MYLDSNQIVILLHHHHLKLIHNNLNMMKTVKEQVIVNVYILVNYYIVMLVNI